MFIIELELYAPRFLQRARRKGRLESSRRRPALLGRYGRSTWTPLHISENMSEPLSVTENKLNELNKKIVEIKKKIQLSGNGSNCTKHPSLIYTVLNEVYTRVNAAVHCAVTELRTQILYKAYTRCLYYRNF